MQLMNDRSERSSGCLAAKLGELDEVRGKGSELGEPKG
jgi:hypothetical protein